jgi:hypothetical protein
MKPLSPLKFLKGSFAKILPMTVTVCLGVAVLYFMLMFVAQLDGQVDKNILEPMRYSSIVISGSGGINREHMEKFESEIESQPYFLAQYVDVSFYGVVGSTSTVMILTEKGNIEKTMDAMGLTLAAGSMPGKPMEVVIHKQLAANHGLEVGSVVEKGQRGWRTDGDIKVVGLLEGEPVFSLGIADSSLLTPETPNVSLAVLFDQGQLQETNAILNDIFAGEYNLFTYEMVLGIVGNVKGSLDGIKTFVAIVMVFVLGVFLANITAIQYSVRKMELETLHAIGYTRKYLIKKALTEIGASSFLGYLLGIILAVLICWAINMLSWGKLGLSLPLYSLNAILAMLLVPAAITLFSIASPLKLTRFQDIA